MKTGLRRFTDDQRSCLQIDELELSSPLAARVYLVIFAFFNKDVNF
jgi:hypothetical protein